MRFEIRLLYATALTALVTITGCTKGGVPGGSSLPGKPSGLDNLPSGRSQAKPVVFLTEQAELADIVVKIVAAGSIVPRQKVEVKPKVSGVLSELYVEPGKIVKTGDPLGKISFISDATQINQAESMMRTAQTALSNAKRELKHNEALFKQGLVPDAELQRLRADVALRQHEATVAGSRLQLVREGARARDKSSTLIVTATASGTVIDLPVKVGLSVFQANDVSAGTTLAVIADMDDIIFDGQVDETEVGKIRDGMKLAIKVDAIEKDKLDGTLEYIASKGYFALKDTEQRGAIQFEIKAAVKKPAGVQIRANDGASAAIILEEKNQVLAIRAALVQTEHAKPFVEIETTPQTFVKRDVKLGVSDGIKVEVLEGVTKADKVKIPDNAGPAAPGPRSDAPAKK